MSKIVCVALTAIAFGVLLVGAALRFFLTILRGTKITGAVAQRIVEQGSRGPNRGGTTRFRAVVKYDVDGKEYRIETRVATAGTLPHYEGGQPVSVYFLPHRPHCGVLFSRVEVFKWIVLMAAGIVAVAVGVVLLLVKVGAIEHHTF